MKYVSWIIESIWMYVKMWFSVNLYQDETWSKSKPKAYNGNIFKWKKLLNDMMIYYNGPIFVLHGLSITRG